jgi:DNA-binding CsgD family transcriptional regulator
LPAPLTSFVGRDRDLAGVRRLLTEHRLVTLTGFGGVGKTRLALEVAADLLGVYLDGIWLVELASLADARLVPWAVASALDLGEHPAAAAQTTGPALSPREREVVTLLARGLSNRELADALVVSQLTAASHVRNILRKLGLDRRGQVAAWAAEHGVTTGRQQPVE